MSRRRDHCVYRAVARVDPLDMIGQGKDSRVEWDVAVSQAGVLVVVGVVEASQAVSCLAYRNLKPCKPESAWFRHLN